MPVLARVLCSGDEDGVLARLVESGVSSIHEDATDILCNIAAAIPKDEAWFISVLAGKLNPKEEKMDICLAAFAKSVQVLKYSPARTKVFEALEQAFHDNVAGFLCGNDDRQETKGNDENDIGDNEREIRIAALEIIYQGSQLGIEVREKILLARHGVSSLVRMVTNEDPRQRMPQRAAQALLNLCKAEGGGGGSSKAGQVVNLYMEALLETAASTSHAELTSIVVELIDEIHFSMRPKEDENVIGDIGVIPTPGSTQNAPPGLPEHDNVVDPANA